MMYTRESNSNSKNKIFWSQQNEAKKFGVAAVRPQDIDRGLAKEMRRVNLELTPTPAPADYRDQLEQWIKSIPQFPIPILNDFNDSMIVQQMKPDDTEAALNQIQPPKTTTFGILSLDFEFHKENSYDGFISVGSVSSETKTTVVSCLYENRKNAQYWMGRMLKSRRIMKVMCGMDNDIIRLQKEWNSFPIGIVDIQDCFVIWKIQNFLECFEYCSESIKTRLKEKRKKITADAMESYLRSLEKPGLAFLSDVFFGAKEDRKQKVVTFADWRLYPLPSELITYSAEDSYLTLRIFYILAEKIKVDGIKAAARMSVKKMFPKFKLTAYKTTISPSVISNPTVKTVLRWRKHVAVNLDFPPGKVLADDQIASFSRKLDKNTSVDSLKQLLQLHGVPGNISCLAKSLIRFIEDPKEPLPQGFLNCVCHNCMQEGHCATMCPHDDNPWAKKKEFYDKTENLKFKLCQDERRRVKWCEKRGLDVATFTDYPWLNKLE